MHNINFKTGKKEEGIRLIQKIAKRNGVELDKGMLNRLEYKDESQDKNCDDKKLLLKTFKSKVMMQRFLVCMVWWLTITLINYGMMISAVFIDGNKYINFAILMVMDIPSNIFYWLALSKYKRKMPLIVSFMIGGIFCITQPFLPKGKNDQKCYWFSQSVTFILHSYQLNENIFLNIVSSWWIYIVLTIL